MKYRGLSPLQQGTVWVIFMVAVGVIVGATGPRAVAALADLAQVAPSKLPWVATRVIAFLSYFAITGSVVYGLLLSTKILDAIAHRPVSFALHQDLAAIGFGLAGVHVVLLGLDATVPFSFGDMLIPFIAPYRPLWVGVGQLALYIVGVVIASFYLRRRIGQRTWRLLHYLTFVSFIGATVHGIMSGSDSGTAWAWWSYVAATALVVFLTGYRVVTGVMAARERAARPAPAPRSAPGPGPGPGPGLRPAPALAPLDFRAPHHGPRPAPRDEARPDR
jgi:methionine sulfoxide reductase heme-binding subunit